MLLLHTNIYWIPASAFFRFLLGIVAVQKPKPASPSATWDDSVPGGIWGWGLCQCAVTVTLPSHQLQHPWRHHHPPETAAGGNWKGHQLQTVLIALVTFFGHFAICFHGF